jgi:hypothetical protein
VKVDRVLKSGETFRWEGYTLTADWMPGQTEFAMGLHGMIDGRKVIFTGDNIFANARDPGHTGHEAIVARNSGILEEGYIYGAELLARVKPDLILGGHSFVMDDPAGLIERYRAWAYSIRETFRSLSTDEDYRYWFDPFWVRAEPYRVTVKRGGSVELRLHVRNFHPRPEAHRIEVHVPPGLTAETELLEGSVAAESREAFPVRLRAAADARTGVCVVAFDVTRDGRRLGQLFDCILNIEP